MHTWSRELSHSRLYKGAFTASFGCRSVCSGSCEFSFSD